MQIKNKLNNLIVSTFLLLFVNKIMFTKCLFSAPKVLFFAKWVLFLLKMWFFSLEEYFFKVLFLPKSTTIPAYDITNASTYGRNQPLSDKLAGEHTGQGLPYLGFQVSAVNLFGMHLFHKSPLSTKYSPYQITTHS